MADDRDVLGKADALLKRHAAETGTGGIPVLTDLIEPPVSPQTDGTSVAGEISAEVFSRVMVEVEGHLASELERRLVEHLQGEVHVAVASALGDLRQDVANAIGDAVSEALKRRQLK
ncbi:hypothetical protein BWI17_19655 [Betaproteobacteria bacterium GR16-43]|nr:hypothetical protein BWI17_19655 [Betaproteobacteria bacterium GR16-43]